MKKIKYICLVLFASIGLQATTCDIPEPYSSLCNYTPLNVPDVVDTFGVQSGHIFNVVEKSRFPAQELLGLAMSGNTDAMKLLAGLSTDKNWSEYWQNKRRITLGLPERKAGENFRQWLERGYEYSAAYKKLLVKAKYQYIKEGIECEIATHDRHVKLPDYQKLTFEELANKGYECAIDRVINDEQNKVEENPNYKRTFDMEKISKLSDKPSVYEEVVGCFSNTNPNGDSFCGKFTSNKQAVVKYAKAYATSKNEYEIGIDTDQETFSLLLKTARKAVNKGIEKQDQNMVEDAIYYYRQALQIPIKDKKKLDTTRYELAFLLDPASKVYAKANFSDVVELLMPNYQKVNIDKCDSFSKQGPCREITNYITSTLVHHTGFGFDDDEAFNFNETYLFHNLSEAIVTSYVQNSKNREYRKNQLKNVNLCLSDEKDPWVGSCKNVLKNTQQLESKEEINIKELSQGLFLAFSMDQNDAFLETKPKYELYKESFYIPSDNANYAFDKLYLTYSNKVLEHLLKKDNIKIENNKNDKYSYSESIYPININEVIPDFERLYLQKKKCKPMSDKYPLNTQCNMNNFFDIKYLKTLPEYKQAKEAGSIYALIADGTLKTEGINDSKDNTYESINNIFEKWNSLQIYQIPHFGTPGKSAHSYYNYEPNNSFDLEWLIFALDKYKIKTTLKPFYTNSKAGNISLEGIPKKYRYSPHIREDIK